MDMMEVGKSEEAAAPGVDDLSQACRFRFFHERVVKPASFGPDDKHYHPLIRKARESSV